jgi:hypothetical protein
MKEYTTAAYEGSTSPSEAQKSYGSPGDNAQRASGSTNRDKILWDECVDFWYG